MLTVVSSIKAFREIKLNKKFAQTKFCANKKYRNQDNMLILHKCNPPITQLTPNF